MSSLKLIMSEPKKLDLIPGTDEWLAERKKHYCASDAPTMMGDNPAKTRDAYIKEKATGITAPVSQYTEEVIFANGHRIEDLARPIAAKRMQEILKPAVYVRTVNGLPLLGSVDGAAIDIIDPIPEALWEHKQFNKELFELVKSGGELTGKHYWQLEHITLIAGCDKITFSVSNGTEEKYADFEYTSRPERRTALIAGWVLTDQDIANYVPSEEKAPEVVGELVEEIPELSLEMDLMKEIQIRTNLDVVIAAAQKLVKNAKVELVTDQDFANAVNLVASYKKTASKIEEKINEMLGKLGDVTVTKEKLEQIKDYLKEAAKAQEKQIEKRKVTRKDNIVLSGKTRLAAHIDVANAKLREHGVKLPDIKADFALAIKGKSNFDNMEAAVNSALQKAKVATDLMLAHILNNLEILAEAAAGFEHLFDTQFKQTHIARDDVSLLALIKAKIADNAAAVAATIKNQAAVNDYVQYPADVKVVPSSEGTGTNRATINSQPAQWHDTLQFVELGLQAEHLPGLKFALALFEQCQELQEDYRTQLDHAIGLTQSLTMASKAA
jgi:predicted phage-related endonuclease